MVNRQALSVFACMCSLLLYSALVNAVDLHKSYQEEIMIDLSVAMLHLSVPEYLGADYSERRYYDKQANIFDNKLYESAWRGWVVFSHLWAFKGHFWQGYTGELLVQVVVTKKFRKDLTLENYNPLFKNREVVTINGAPWMRIEDIGEEINYAMLLTEDHILVVRFLFIDDSNGKNIKWKAKAQRYVDAIVPTIKLEWKSPQPLPAQ